MKNNIYRSASVLAACVTLCSSCGPHMNVQPAVRPYTRIMPQMPSGTVPTRGRLITYTTQQSKLTNPLPATPQNIANGKIFYGYYCLMCHGEKGDGYGPVGTSYVPRPADLTKPPVSGMPDGALYNAMLFGVGHEPVLDQTVNPAQRWPIVLYVRTFVKSSK